MVKPMNETQTNTLGYRMLRVASEQYGRAPSALDGEELSKVTQIAKKEQLIEQAVLMSEEARQVVVPESQVEEALSQVVSRYEDEDKLHEDLAQNNLDIDELRSALARELRVDAVMDFVSRSVEEVDDTEVSLFFYLHPDQFQRPETRSARHILITVNDQFSENSLEVAQRRLRVIRERVLKTPHRFKEQALKHSECPTALEEGKLGRVKKGMLYPELDSVLFQMKEGDISGIVESPVGLHILLCESIHPEEVLSFDEVKPQLKEQLTQRERSRFQKQWLKSLLSDNSNQTTHSSEEKKGWQNQPG